MDNNQSVLHNQIKVQAHEWFKVHGFKPMELEVCAEPKWIADIGGVIQPTNTEAIKLKLIECCSRRDGTWQEWRDRARLITDGIYTMLCEVKAFRSDFLKDKNTKFIKTPAHMNFLAYEKGILNKDELPAGWFGLERIGKNRFKYAVGKVTEDVNDKWALVFLVSLAMRMHNAYHYQYMRERIKEYNAENVDRQNHYKVSRVVSAIVNIISGDSMYEDMDVERALKYHDINQFRDYDIERLKELRERLKTISPK